MFDNFLKGLQIGVGFFFTILVLFGIVYAVGFHSANEITGGVFQGNYTFNGTLTLGNSSLPNLSSSDLRIFKWGGNETVTLNPGNDANTLLLIHSDTTDGSTTFVDSSSAGETVTAEGAAQHSTDQAKFGSSSIRVGPTDTDMLAVGTSTDFQFGSGDFTIDTWVRFNSWSTESNGYETIFAKEENGVSGEMLFIFYDGPSGVTNQQRFTTYWYNDGSGTSRQYIYGPTSSLSLNQWYHVAFVRTGNRYLTYLDGTLIDNESMTGTLYPSTRQTRIGGWYNGGNPENADAYFDEYRISNIARWTGPSFTPDTYPYGLNYSIGEPAGIYVTDGNGGMTKIS